MTQSVRHIKSFMLLCAAALLASSCQGLIRHYEPPICDYSVQLTYHYNVENSSGTNEILGYVNSIDEYLFDADGILYAVNPLRKDPCTGEWVSELMLPPGRYSVIAIGNRTGISPVTDDHAAPVVGQTSRDDMLLTLDRSQTRAGTDAGFADRLYHGYRTFCVENGQTSQVRVDMVHSHLIIYYKIMWEESVGAGSFTDLHVRMEDAPSEYSLMPEFIYPEPQGACLPHDPATHDPYSRICRDCVHHIPTVHNDCNYMGFSDRSTVFGQEATGSVISYRIRNTPEESRPTTFTVWDGDTPLANTVPLNDFFTRSGIDLDHTRRQEYPLVFLIHRDGTITVTFATVEDWEEGGTIKF